MNQISETAWQCVIRAIIIALVVALVVLVDI